MVDNIQLNPGAGGDILATDDDGTAQHQYVKVEFGGDGAFTKVEATAPLPTQLTDGTTAIDTAVDGAAHGASQPGLRAMGSDGTNDLQLVTTAGGILKVDVAASSATADVNVVELNGTTIATNTGALTAGTIRAVITTDQLPLKSVVGDNASAVDTSRIANYNLIYDDQGNNWDRERQYQADETKLSYTGGITELRGPAIMGVRQDADTSPVNATGDIHGLVFDDAGALKVNVKTSTASGSTQYAEDTAHVTGDTITMAGVVQQAADAALSGDGDRSLMQVDANGFLKVNIKAGAGSGGTASTDDSPFTAGAGSGTPAMGFFSTDTVEANDVGVLAMDASRRLLVSIEADNVGIGGGTQYTLGTDTYLEGTSVGTLAGAVRNDTLAALANTDNELAPLQVNATGALYVEVDSSALPAGAATEATLADCDALLGTIDADTSILAGAVAAGQMQVDIVADGAGLGTAANQATIIGHVDGIEALLTTIETNTDYGTVVGGGLEATALRVTLASDSTGQITVDGTVTANLGTIAGVATEATLSSIDTDTSTIAGDTTSLDTKAVQQALGGGVEAGALLVTVASDSTGVLSVDDNAGSLTVDAPVGTPVNVQIGDGTNTAAIHNLAANDALSVAIVDGAGTQITSFGGGTQYTEGDAGAANPVGTSPVMLSDSTPALEVTEGQFVAQRATRYGAAYTQIVDSAGNFIDTFGGSGGTSAADDADFTAGTTPGTPSMGVYESSPTSVTDGDLGIVGITQTRALRVDGSGSTQPVSGTVTADTELPAAAALSDTFANPTAPAVGAFGMLYDRVTDEWHRAPDTVVSDNNSTTSTLGIAGVWTATADDVEGFSAITVQLDASHNSATDLMTFQFSVDNTNWDDIYAFNYTAADGARRFQFPVTAKYFRNVYTNGGTGQTHFRVQTILHRNNVLTSIHKVEDNVKNDRSAQLVKSVLLAQLNGAGDFTPVAASAQGALDVSLEDVAGQPISVGNGSVGPNGTIRVTIADDSTGVLAITAAALPLPSGAATSALQLPDGHNVTVDNAAGASAVNIQDGGNSITVDNATISVVGSGVGTTAQRVRLSTDSTLAANQSVNVAQMNGVATSMGNGISGTGTQRVTIASDSTGKLEVVGDVAHDAAAAGNPVLTGGVAQACDDTLPPNRVSTENDAARVAMDFSGAVFVRPHGPQVWSYHLDTSTAQADATVHAAPGAGLSLYVGSIAFSSGAATAINLFFEESATKVLGPYYLEATAGRGCFMQFNPPKKISANVALTLTTSASIAHSVDVTGFTAQG